MQEIVKFPRTLSYYGRNKYGIQTGIELFFIQEEPHNEVRLYPTNSRGTTDSCFLGIPNEMLPEVIGEMLKMSGLSLQELALSMGYVIGSPFQAEDIRRRFEELKEIWNWENEITDEDIKEIFQIINRTFNASIGINWDSIDAAIKYHFNQ